MGIAQRVEIEVQVRRIADLIHTDHHVHPDTPAGEVADLFDRNPLLDGVVVVLDGRPALLARSSFMTRLRGKFGYALFQKRPVSWHAETDCLIVESHADPVDVVQLATQRSADRIYDDIVVVENGRYLGLVSMRFLMTHSKDLLAQSIADVAFLEERARNLEQINRQQREFVANMTHELRAPLNTMIGMAQLLVDDADLPDSARRQAAAMGCRGVDLLGIVNDMLDFYKLEAGAMEAAVEAVDLRELFEEAIESARFLVKSDKVLDVRAELGPLPDTFLTDPVFLRRILTNLLSNAVKFTESGGVTLLAEQTEHGIYIRVTDTGIGMKPEDLERIFAQFTQLESTRTKHHGGTGLGLTIVKSLVELLGGGIEVESEWGVGTTFHLRLPGPE